jgi:hypothetical protein
VYCPRSLVCFGVCHFSAWGCRPWGHRPPLYKGVNAASLFLDKGRGERDGTHQRVSSPLPNAGEAEGEGNKMPRSVLPDGQPAILFGLDRRMATMCTAPHPAPVPCCGRRGQFSMRLPSRGLIKPVEPISGKPRHHCPELSPPPGIPSVPFPKDSPPTRERIELGRQLFFDAALQQRKRKAVRAATTKLAFADNEVTSRGIDGERVGILQR